MATLAQSPVKGGFVRLPGLREAIAADREMNARKWAHSMKGKGKATTSPSMTKYAIEVETRSLSIYGPIGGTVAYV